jgi:hypothetical protein
MEILKYIRENLMSDYNMHSIAPNPIRQYVGNIKDMDQIDLSRSVVGEIFYDISTNSLYMFNGIRFQRL